MKTVAIIHGWAEGPWQSRKFRQELKQQGFEPEKDASKAEIIIGHSLGCYLVPANQAKLIVLIGLPYWPGLNVPASLARKLWLELTHHRRSATIGWWLNKLAHNIWYIVSKPLMTYYIFSMRKLKNLPSGKNQKVLLIRPRNDTFCHPNIKDRLSGREYYFVELPGAHDDCWFKPEPCIELIQKHL
ncbi:hypothetical protein HY380_01895 [Candidatus Saccharibacteria bacterium]|nr:hypothetical protein [Candidatus Saccharibacteria bacterium]